MDYLNIFKLVTLTVEVEHEVMPLLKQLLENFKGVNKVSVHEEIVAYTTKGEPLTAVAMKNIIQARIDGIENGTEKTYTTEEVFRSILKR